MGRDLGSSPRAVANGYGFGKISSFPGLSFFLLQKRGLDNEVPKILSCSQAELEIAVIQTYLLECTIHCLRSADIKA